MVSATLFVVDDDPAIRAALDRLGRSVALSVETFASAQAFLDAYDPARPGCLVLDVRMPGMSGLELQRHLKEHGVPLPIIMITGHADVPVAVQAMKEGALDFLEKPFNEQLLLEKIHAALERDAQQRIAACRRAAFEARLATLTERERQVMERVVSGQVSKQIAVELGISKKTVDVHRSHVMRKLEVDSVPDLVAQVLAVRGGDALGASAPTRPAR